MILGLKCSLVLECGHSSVVCETQTALGPGHHANLTLRTRIQRRGPPKIDPELFSYIDLISRLIKYDQWLWRVPEVAVLVLSHSKLTRVCPPL